MNELITTLTEKAGITPEQASKVLDAVKDFVKEKFPMMAGAVDNLLGSDTAPATSTDAPPVTDIDKEDSPFDVIKDKFTNLLGGDVK